MGVVPSINHKSMNQMTATLIARRRPVRPKRRQRRSGSSMMRVRYTGTVLNAQGATAGGRVANTTSRMPAFSAISYTWIRVP